MRAGGSILISSTTGGNDGVGRSKVYFDRLFIFNFLKFNLLDVATTGASFADSGLVGGITGTSLNGALWLVEH